MAKTAKIRLDRKSLAELGLDKLVEILLAEAASNKPLKARLETALAGTAGKEEVARMIGHRLDLLEKAKTSINRPRAKDLTVELTGLIRTIEAELGAADTRLAVEQLLRLAGMRDSFEKRLNSDSARLIAVFADAETAAGTLILDMGEDDQLKLVPTIEAARAKDRYGESEEFYSRLIKGLSRKAARAWQDLLEPQLAAPERTIGVSRLLQRLYQENGDVDGFVRLEARKPADRQDTMAVAGLLMREGRFEAALEWVRKPPAAKRILHVHGLAVMVGPDYEQKERRLLEADILDHLKRREEAQTLRWQVFLDGFDADVLRRYIARLDDFAEFDETDRAIAAALDSDRIHEALAFLVAWPKLEKAALLVERHKAEWDGRNYELLLPAAEALETSHPQAAVILYRALISNILDRGISAAYEAAAGYLKRLASLSVHLQGLGAPPDHADFVIGLQSRHPRKFGFWQRVPLA
ncbi:MAG: hypothetical protein RLZZ444_2599 [Pseudomonadota bacterium]|jgi:hypothetical protein